MAILAKDSGGDFTPAPEGLWPGVCVDVVDLGIIDKGQYGPKHMVQLRWVLDAEPPLPTGKPHMASRRFGLSLSEKSHLRPFLEAWRGKKFSTEELAGFDLENLIGACGQFQIIHNSHNGKTYGNVQAVVPYPRNAPKMTVPTDYVRQCERDHRADLEAHPDGHENDAQYEPADADIPF